MDMNLFKDLRKIMEDDSVQEPTPDVDMDLGDTEAPVVTELTEEEIAELAEVVGVTPEQMDEFKKGIVVEMEHLDTVGGDKEIIAKIALDHIKEFTVKSYYDALATMEEELKETPEEEAAEVEAEIPAGEGAPVAAAESKVPADPNKVDDTTIKSLQEEAVPAAVGNVATDVGDTKDLPKDQVKAEPGFDQAKDAPAGNVVTDIKPEPEVAAPVATDKPKADDTKDLPAKQTAVEPGMDNAVNAKK
jgi:hypothetical protein